MAELPRYPDAVIKRPLTLPKGFLEAGAKFSPELVGPAGFARFPLTPFASYGVVDAVTVGLFTQSSFCFGSECSGRFTADTKVWNDLALDAKVRLMEEQDLSESMHLALAFHGGIDLPSLTDPFALGPRAGVTARLRTGAFAFVVDPSLYLGVTARDREITTTSAGTTRTVAIPVNRERLDIPLTILFQLKPEIAFFATTGINGQLTGYDFGRTFRVPLGLGATFTINHSIDLFGSFTFVELLGAPGVRQERLVGQLGAAFRFDTAPKAAEVTQSE